MTTRAVRFEVAAPGACVAGQYVRDLDGAAAADRRFGLRFLIVNVGDDCREIGVRERRKRRHAGFGAARAHDGADTLSPRASVATSSERVKSLPPEPPVASGPWQNPQSATNRARPAATTSGAYSCGAADGGTGRAAGAFFATGRLRERSVRRAEQRGRCNERAAAKRRWELHRAES